MNFELVVWYVLERNFLCVGGGGWVGAGKLLHINHRIRDRCEYRQVFGYYTEEEAN